MRLSADDITRQREDITREREDITRERAPAHPSPRSSIWGVELVVAIVGVIAGLSAALFLLS